MRFAPDAGTQNHLDSVLHCRVNGGEMARLGTADAYKTGTIKCYYFMFYWSGNNSVKANILINTHIFLMQIIIIWCLPSEGMTLEIEYRHGSGIFIRMIWVYKRTMNGNRELLIGIRHTCWNRIARKETVTHVKDHLYRWKHSEKIIQVNKTSATKLLL